MAPDTRTISLTVNGQPHVAQVEPRRLLVDFLREDLGLPGPTSAASTASAGPAPCC
jgi:Aerobic-type carbon monoxide dehydrogenase, small subunit CoxS/CutS homologs